MNVSLSPQLKQFVDRQVKAGRFENANDAISDALRLLEKRDKVVANLRASYVGLGNMAEQDIMALVFTVLMEAAKSAQEDLREIMASVKAINATKAAQRDLIGKITQDVAANAGRTGPLRFSARGIGSEKGYHRLPVPHLDVTSATGVRRVPTDLHPGRIDAKCVLAAIRDSIKGDLDSMSELGELESLRLQMAMDRYSKAMSTLSNVLKKISETQGTIISNLK